MSVLIIEKREGTGTGCARSCRREQKIPAVVYGPKQASVSVFVDEKEIIKRYKQGGLQSKVLNVNFDGKEKQILIKSIQRNVVTDKIIHLDLLLLDKGDMVKVSVSFKPINADKAPGVKKGGVVNLVMHNIELSLLSENIPEFIPVDLTGLDLNQSVLLKSVSLPKDSRIVKVDISSTLLTIIPPSGLRAKMSGAEEEEEEESEKETTE